MRIPRYVMQPSKGTVLSERSDVRIAIVGLGRQARIHAENILKSTPEATLSCVCSPELSDRVWAAQNPEWRDVRIYSTFEQMIEQSDIQAVIICSPTEFHAKQTVIALENGLHVLCEKPAAPSIVEVHEMLRSAEAHPDLKFMIGFARRFDESYRDARIKIQDGFIGSPRIFESHAMEKYDDSAFFKEYLQASSGIFVDSVIHDIDLCLSFMGEDLKLKSVHASGEAIRHKQLTEQGDSDDVTGLVSFWGGNRAIFHNSRTLCYGYDNTTTIRGDNGRKIAVNSIPRSNRVELFDERGVGSEPTPGWYERYAQAYIAEIKEFVAAISNNTDVPIPPRSSLTSLRIALLLQDSLKTGETFHFDQDGHML